MAVNVAELVATLALDDSDLQYGLQRVNRLLMDQDRAAQAAAQGLRNIEAAGRDIATLGRTLSIGITLPIVAIGAAALKSTADMDQLRQGLIATTGSAAAANKELKDLIEIGRGPGIGFQQAVQGALGLQNAGLSAKQAAGAIRELGNALAMAGHSAAELPQTERALQNIAARGQVTNREIRQLALHIPQIRELMTAVYGTNDPKRIAESGLTGTQFINDMVEAMKALPRVQQTINSEFINLRDSATRAFAVIGEAAGTHQIIGNLRDIGKSLENTAAAFARLPESTRTGIVHFGLFAAAVGPVLFVAGTLITSLMNIRAGYVALVGFGATLDSWWKAKTLITEKDTAATELNTLSVKANTDALRVNGAVAVEASQLRSGAGAVALPIAGVGSFQPGPKPQFVDPNAAALMRGTAGVPNAAAAAAADDAALNVSMGYGATAGLGVAGAAALAKMRTPTPLGMGGKIGGALGRMVKTPLGFMLASEAISMGLSYIGDEAEKKSPGDRGGLGGVFARVGGRVASDAGFGAMIGMPFEGIGAVPGAIIGGTVGLGMGVWDEMHHTAAAATSFDPKDAKAIQEARARGDITAQEAGAMFRKLHGTAARPGDTELISKGEISEEASDLIRQEQHQKDVMSAVKFKGLKPGQKAESEFARARAEQFRAELEQAQAETENVDEQKRPFEEAKRIIPMLAARRQVLAKEAEALKPQIQTDAKAAEDYWRLEQEIGRLQLEGSRLQARAMHARSVQHKQALAQTRENRDLIRNIAVAGVESQIGIAPEHMRAQTEALGMEPILRGAQEDIRKQQVDLTHEKRTPEVIRDYLRLELEYWKREQEIQRLKRSAQSEITANAHRAQKEQEQAGQAKLNAELDFQRLRATHAPEGEDAQANVKMVVPVLQDIMKDQFRALSETEPGSKEYWDGVREIIKIEGQIQSYQNSAIKERAAAQKKLQSEAKQQRSELRQGLELETRLIEQQMENNPFLTEQQKRQAMMPRLLQQFRELSTPIKGETHNEQLQREIDAARLEHQIEEGAGFSKQNFAKTIGGGRIFTGNIGYTRGVLAEIERTRQQAQSGFQGKDQPTSPTSDGGEPVVPASPFSQSYQQAMEYNRMHQVGINRGPTIQELNSIAAQRKRESDLGYDKAQRGNLLDRGKSINKGDPLDRGDTIINNSVVLHGGDQAARKKQFEDLWKQVEDALYHPVGTIPGQQ